MAGSGIAKARKRPLWLDLKSNYNLYLMMLPVFAGFILFKYLPIYGIVIGFKDYDIVKGIFGSKWVGFKYFLQFFHDPYFFRILRNTIVLGFYGIVFGFWPPILLALSLNEIRSPAFKRVVQSISYLPHFIATVVIVGMLFELFGTESLVNDFLSKLGLDRVPFLSNARYFRSLYIGSGIWQGIGWSSILYMAALTGVDQELYYAASIDGAGRFRRMLHISLPGILPTIRICLIFAVSGIISVGFEKAYLMQNPAVYETADVIATYVYRQGIQQMNFSYGTAIGLFEGIIAMLMLIGANYVSRKISDEGLW
jgi:putative aldouronate transport system permease protein